MCMYREKGDRKIATLAANQWQLKSKFSDFRYHHEYTDRVSSACSMHQRSCRLIFLWFSVIVDFFAHTSSLLKFLNCHFFVVALGNTPLEGLYQLKTTMTGNEIETMCRFLRFPFFCFSYYEQLKVVPIFLVHYQKKQQVRCYIKSELPLLRCRKLLVTVRLFHFSFWVHFSLSAIHSQRK